MPRYEYRVLNPTPAAERVFLEWIEKLDEDEQAEVAEAVEEVSSDPDQLSFAQQLTEMFSQMKEAASKPRKVSPLEKLMDGLD